MQHVPSTFPTVPRSTLGYDVDEVERFLADARAAYVCSGALDRGEAVAVSGAGASAGALVDGADEDTGEQAERERELDFGGF